MRFVLRREKGRLVMVEPPGQAVGGRILEIHNRVLVSVEHLFVKERAGTMEQPCVFDAGRGANSCEVKAREDGGRGDAVKAVSVIEQAKFHLDDLVCE